jgi:hypothetical protein
MTGRITGTTECRRERAAIAVMERMEKIGSASDRAYTEGAVLASMAACGEVCGSSGTCLANNPNSDSGLIELYTGIFEEASLIGVNCETVTD